MKKIILILISLSVILFTGCGGGSDGVQESSSGGTSSNVESNDVSGRVADGYLVGAKICLDINDNRMCDDNEPYDITTAGGEYTISSDVYNTSDYTLFVEIDLTTIDEDTNESVGATYTLSAPPGATFVSPISDLIRTNMDSNTSISYEDAKLMVSQELNISIDEIEIDYVATGSTGIHTKAQNMVKIKQSIQTLKDGDLIDVEELSEYGKNYIAKNVYAFLDIDNLDINTLDESVKQYTLLWLLSKSVNENDLSHVYDSLSTETQNAIKAATIDLSNNPYSNNYNGFTIISGTVSEADDITINRNTNYRVATEPFEYTSWHLKFNHNSDTEACTINYLNDFDHTLLSTTNIDSANRIYSNQFIDLAYYVENVKYIDFNISCELKNTDKFENIISKEFNLVNSNIDHYSEITYGSFEEGTLSLIESTTTSTTEHKFTTYFTSKISKDSSSPDVLGDRELKIDFGSFSNLINSEIDADVLDEGVKKIVLEYDPNSCDITVEITRLKIANGSEDKTYTFNEGCILNPDDIQVRVKTLWIDGYDSSKLHYNEVTMQR